MKTLIFLLLIICISSNCFSQNTESKKNEISLGLLNIERVETNLDKAAFDKSMSPFFIRNLSYKRFFNEKHILRISVFRTLKTTYHFFPETDKLITYKKNIIRIGYGHIFRKKTVSPYYLIDFSLTSNKGRINNDIETVYNTDVNKFEILTGGGIEYSIGGDFNLGFEADVVIYSNNFEYVFDFKREYNPGLYFVGQINVGYKF